MNADALTGLALAATALVWLTPTTARWATARLDAWAESRVDRMVDDWERHVADAVALNERTVYEQTLADFPEPPLFLDEDAGRLMADEAEAWLRGEAS